LIANDSYSLNSECPKGKNNKTLHVSKDFVKLRKSNIRTNYKR